MSKNWRVTIEPDDGSGAKYGYLVDEDQIDTGEVGTLAVETIEHHEWVDPNVPTGFTITVQVTGERGPLGSGTFDFDLPTDELGLEDTLGYVCNEVSGVVRPYLLPSVEEHDG